MTGYLVLDPSGHGRNYRCVRACHFGIDCWQPGTTIKAILRPVQVHNITISIPVRWADVIFAVGLCTWGRVFQ